MSDMERIHDRLERMEDKLDKALECGPAITYLKWIVGGAWAAIAGLFLTHK